MNLEYRVPLFDIDVAPWTLPFFLRRLYAAAFVDYGTATNEIDGFNGWLTSVGGELRLQSSLGYTYPADFRLGVAYGIARTVPTQIYLLYGGAF